VPVPQAADTLAVFVYGVATDAPAGEPRQQARPTAAGTVELAPAGAHPCVPLPGPSAADCGEVLVPEPHVCLPSCSPDPARGPRPASTFNPAGPVAGPMPPAVVLLSGGLDSTVTAATARADGHDLHALTFRYGQRHERELQAARDVAEALDAVEHRVLEVDLSAWGGSALTDPDLDVPEDRSEDEIEDGIPVTYVPARNLVFLSIATSFAETREAEAVYIGANAVDFSGYPDCRPRFLEAFEEAARLGTKRGVEGTGVAVEAPLVDLPKQDIVELGVDLDAPLDRTWTCYQGGEVQCGRCDACQLRREGFEDAGYEDPVAYEA